MDTDFNMILAVAGAISSVGGAWLVIRKIQKDVKKEREVESAKILQEAKEFTSSMEKSFLAEKELLEKEIDARFDNIKTDLENFKENVDKDLHHLRETYNGEIRNLGQKIEDLRSEIRNQHTQMVGLLTKMIDSRD